MMTDRDIRNGMKEARAEGLAEGLAEGKAEMARAMKERGLDLRLISEISGLSAEEIARL